jgi:hypothetical protein
LRFVVTEQAEESTRRENRASKRSKTTDAKRTTPSPEEIIGIVDDGFLDATFKE